MSSQSNTQAGHSRVQLHRDFVDGLACFRSDDYAAALMLFRRADEGAAIDDIYQNRYTSFHGLARLCLGDLGGVKLCRKAAVGETNDAEIYYNLALAECRLGFWESASHALRRGLLVAPGHPGLLQLEEDLGLGRQHGLFTGLKPEKWINRLLNGFLRGSRQPHSDR